MAISEVLSMVSVPAEIGERAAQRAGKQSASAWLRRSVQALVLLCFGSALLGMAGCGITYNTLPLTATPSSFSFGSVPVGQTQSGSVTLHNGSFTAVSLTGIDLGDSAFAVSQLQLPTRVAAGSDLTLYMTFTPQSAQDYSAHIAVNTTGGRASIAVSGSGNRTAGGGQPSKDPVLQTSAPSLQFGSEPVGSQTLQTVTLSSTGSAPVHITQISSLGSPFSAQSPALPLSVAPGHSVVVPVAFVPSAAGTAAGQLVVVSDAVGAASLVIPLAGNGVSAAPPAPALSVSTSSLGFGTVTVGASETLSVTLASTGTAPIVIGGIAVSGPGFSQGFASLPLTLAPGQKLSLPVTFAPNSPGAIPGQISLTDNAIGSPSTIALSGTGQGTGSASLSVSPAPVDFGNATVGAGAFKTITMVANGTLPVTVNAVTVAGPVFSAAAPALPLVLQPSQQASIRVQFDPTAVGAATGSVAIATNAATNATATIPLQGVGVAPPVASLAASASGLSFGSQTVGSEVSQTLVVTSTGTAPASITSGTLSGAGFTASYAGVAIQSLTAPIVLQPGQQADFSIAFAPSAVGPASGQLTLATNTGTPITVSLTGAGSAAPVPALSLSATRLDFGSVQVGAQLATQLTLTSSGTAPVTISSASLAGAQFAIASIAYPAGITAWPATLAPGQQVTLSVRFSPTAAGAANGSLTVNSDASGGTAAIPLSGTGTAVPVPNLSLSATSIPFGSVVLGSSVTKTLTLISTGNAPVTITNLVLTGVEFTLAQQTLPVTLQPAQQVTLNLTFSPSATGSFAESLTVSSDAGSGSAIVSLGGSGVASTPTAPVLTPSATALQFGPVNVGATASQTLSVTNTGNAPLILSNIAISGAPFTTTVPSLPVTLQPNQQLSLPVTYAPTNTNGDTGSLTLTSNAGGGTTTIALSGTGVAVAAPVLAASVKSLQFSSVSVGSSASLGFMLTNTGNAPLLIGSIVENGAEFQASPGGPVTLQPGAQITVQAVFAPTSAGLANASVAISSNGGSATVSLTGTGAAVQHEADLSWNAPAAGSDPVAGYNVYRGTVAAGPFQLLNASPVSVASYVDHSVGAGQTYFYLVRSVDSSGVESDASNQISLTIP